MLIYISLLWDTLDHDSYGKKKKQSRRHWGCEIWARRKGSVSNQVVRIELIEKMRFGQRLEGGEGNSEADVWERRPKPRNLL